MVKLAPKYWKAVLAGLLIILLSYGWASSYNIKDVHCNIWSHQNSYPITVKLNFLQKNLWSSKSYFTDDITLKDVGETIVPVHVYSEGSGDIAISKDQRWIIKINNIYGESREVIGVRLHATLSHEGSELASLRQSYFFKRGIEPKEF